MSFWEEDELFTWAADGLVLRSLFPVVIFWVVPWAALRFEDWYVTIVEVAWVFINFFSEGATDTILETGTVAGNLQDAPSYPSSEDQIQHPKKVD